jgi:hypothetical protein
MINVNWRNDKRADGPGRYTTDWEKNHGRLSAFLKGWTKWTDYGHHKRNVLHWQTVGALYASSFGSREDAARVPEVIRCQLYHTALIAYVNSRRCSHWTDEQRELAVQLSADEVVRRGGTILD